MPTKCDFVVTNRKLVSGGSILVLWLTVAMIAVSTMEDLDEAGLLLILLDLALRRRKESPPSRAILFIFWCSLNLRLFLLPSAVAVTTTAVLLTTSPTATNIMMNGLVLTFLTTLDDLAAPLLPESIVSRAQSALETEFAWGAARYSSQGSWRACHKITAMLVTGVIPVICMHMEALMSVPLFNTGHEHGSLCSLMAQTFLKLTVLACLGNCLVRPASVFYGPCLTSHMLPSLSKCHAQLLEYVLSPVIICCAYVPVLTLGFVIHDVQIA